MEEKIREFRVTIDEDIKGLQEAFKGQHPYTDVVKEVSGVYHNSPYQACAEQSLNMAKMWLGMVLKDMGTPNPYPDSMDSSNEKIAPTADVSDGVGYFDAIEGEEITFIKMVKQLRSNIQDRIDYFWKEFKESDHQWSYKANIALTNVYNNLVEAKLWLGMELGYLRDRQEA